VVLAMGLPSWMRRNEESIDLMVELHVSEHVLAELAAYEAEQSEANERELEEQNPGWWAPALYAWTLALCYFQQARYPDLVQRGAVSHQTVWQEGEWWRPLTALTLHGDLLHLLSNIGFGLLWAIPLQRLLGPGLMLWSILATGFFGNLITSALRHADPAVSIGASTAVFGLLGVLVTVRITAWVQLHSRWQWRQVLLPLGAGCALLALLGSQPADMLGHPIDNLAHLFGFLSGLALGPVLQAAFPASWRSAPATHWLAWLTLVPLVAAWGVALSRG